MMTLTIRPLRLLVLTALLCLLPLTAAQSATTVYKKVLPDGSVVFSDEPMDNAETLEVEPVPTIPAYKPTPTPQPTQRSAPAQYSVAISSPKADEHFINNGGQVSVVINVEPALRDGHGVQVKLNGELRAGPGDSTSFNFSNLDRGAYTVLAEVVDKGGKLIQASAPVVFHIQRARIQRQSP